MGRERERLLELAERCEAATGPDIDLDLAISEATKAWQSQPTWRQFQPTASLDAAMTLVPEGHKWLIQQNDSDKPERQHFAELRRGHITSYDKAFPVWAATPALALCAAALRARAAQNQSGD